MLVTSFPRATNYSLCKNVHDAQPSLNPNICKHSLLSNISDILFSQAQKEFSWNVQTYCQNYALIINK